VGRAASNATNRLSAPAAPLRCSAASFRPKTATQPPHAAPSAARRTSLDLGLVLDGVVLLHAAQEVGAAAAGLDVLNAHVDALADDAAAHLWVRWWCGGAVVVVSGGWVRGC